MAENPEEKGSRESADPSLENPDYRNWRCHPAKAVSADRAGGRAAWVARPMGEEPGGKSHRAWKGKQVGVWSRGRLRRGSPWRPLAGMLAP